MLKCLKICCYGVGDGGAQTKQSDFLFVDVSDLNVHCQSVCQSRNLFIKAREIIEFNRNIITLTG